jgi:hypothetical protein
LLQAIASYISLPVAPPDYDMPEAIKLRAIAHSFEGKIFTIVSCWTISDEIIAAMECSGAPGAQIERLLRCHRPQWTRHRRGSDR